MTYAIITRCDRCDATAEQPFGRTGDGPYPRSHTGWSYQWKEDRTLPNNWREGIETETTPPRHLCPTCTDRAYEDPYVT